MTQITSNDSVDLAHRFLSDPSGDELRTDLARLTDLKFHLESSLRKPSSKQVHRSNEAALQAVAAALETLKAVARLWVLKYRAGGEEARPR
ncbi:hypothetical protein [uncultured Hydrogenophaga sp.]|uniref:hypothetical protein n=1 Tax=uncultured Hydrogenophaga sp. TaxID=199683 RepID=UPI00265F42CD|nr:hypothetical protein [uncultured Hydrogenophaga sp.]